MFKYNKILYATMSFDEKLFDLIDSIFTVKRLITGFLILLFIDMLSTFYILTFLSATYEKNIMARPLLSKFGNFWGLIISAPYEFVILLGIFIFFCIFLYILQIIVYRLQIIIEKKVKKWPNIPNLSFRIILFIAIVLHFKAIGNNLLLLVRRIFGL